MTIPLDTKIPILRAFHQRLYEPGWQYHGSMFEPTGERPTRNTLCSSLTLTLTITPLR